MKKRYSEEPIIKAIKQHEAGAKVEDICREFGISNGTFYNWRSIFASEIFRRRRSLSQR
jgi:putative transposase